jgi:sensor domain CHASE-containing protein
MDLSKDQQQFYEQARERCRQDVEQMNNTIRVEWQHLNDEIKRVQELIQQLETRKQTIAQIYASSSEMLGLENDLDVSPAIKDGGEDSADDLGVGEIDL